jgi:hypothetical protein
MTNLDHSLPFVEEIVNRLTASDEVLSRTFRTGVASVATSPYKKPSLLEGQALISQIAFNRRMVARAIADSCIWFPNSACEHLGALLSIATMACHGLLPEGLFRRWRYDPVYLDATVAMGRVAPSEILKSLELLMDRVVNAYTGDELMRLRTVAEIEWNLVVGPLHPFYDACGRISRYYSLLLSDWFSVPTPMHRTREVYFSAARGGSEVFISYYLGRCGIGDREAE